MLRLVWEDLYFLNSVFFLAPFDTTFKVVSSDQTRRLRRLTILSVVTFIMSGPVYERRARLVSTAPVTMATTLEIDEIPTVKRMITFDDTTF